MLVSVEPQGLNESQRVRTVQSARTVVPTLKGASSNEYLRNTKSLTLSSADSRDEVILNFRIRDL